MRYKGGRWSINYGKSCSNRLLKLELDAHWRPYIDMARDDKDYAHFARQAIRRYPEHTKAEAVRLHTVQLISKKL